MIIVDTHPGYDDRTVAMLSVANEILLTVTPEVGPLRNSAQFLQLAHELGIDDTIRVVANRANHGVAIGDMEGALGPPGDRHHRVRGRDRGHGRQLRARRSSSASRRSGSRRTSTAWRGSWPGPRSRGDAGQTERRRFSFATLLRAGERHLSTAPAAPRGVAAPGPPCDHPATCRPTTTDAVTAVTSSRSSTPSSRTGPRPASAAAAR